MHTTNQPQWSKKYYHEIDQVQQAHIREHTRENIRDKMVRPSLLHKEANDQQIYYKSRRL
jgi:hypothetical protein